MSRKHLKTISFEQLQEIVENAIGRIYTRERHLIAHGLAEWVLSAQFHYWVRKYCAPYLKRHNFDSEYNHMHLIDNIELARKYICKNGKNLSVRPDFIIHKRGDSGNNFLWVEMKRVGGEKWKEDLWRVMAVTQKKVKGIDFVTGYDYGLGILFHKKEVVCKWYADSKKKKERIMTINTSGALKWADGGTDVASIFRSSQ